MDCGLKTVKRTGFLRPESHKELCQGLLSTAASRSSNWKPRRYIIHGSRLSGKDYTDVYPVEAIRDVLRSV